MSSTAVQITRDERICFLRVPQSIYHRNFDWLNVFSELWLRELTITDILVFQRERTLHVSRGFRNCFNETFHKKMADKV